MSQGLGSLTEDKLLLILCFYFVLNFHTCRMRSSLLINNPMENNMMNKEWLLIEFKNRKEKKIPVILILSPGNHRLWAVVLKICLSEHFVHKFTAFFCYWWWSNLHNRWADPSQRVSDKHITIASPDYGDLIIQRSQSLKCFAITLVTNLSQEFNTPQHSCL